MCERCVSTVRTLRNSCSGDLGVRVPECDQPQDVELALAEPVRRPLGLGGRGRELGAELGVQVGLAGRRGTHGADQLGAGRVLEHVAERA